MAVCGHGYNLKARNASSLAMTPVQCWSLSRGCRGLCTGSLSSVVILVTETPHLFHTVSSGNRITQAGRDFVRSPVQFFLKVRSTLNSDQNAQGFVQFAPETHRVEPI